MNTFIQYIKMDQFSQLRFNAGQQFLSPKHWFQFADDAVITTGEEYKTQILLNAFTMWCNWAKMSVRVHKCKSFGIIKSVIHKPSNIPRKYMSTIV